MKGMKFNALQIMNLQIQMHLGLSKRTLCYHNAWEVMNKAMMNLLIHQQMLMLLSLHSMEGPHDQGMDSEENFDVGRMGGLNAWEDSNYTETIKWHDCYYEKNC
jgi:hypothetical protein